MNAPGRPAQNLLVRHPGWLLPLILALAAVLRIRLAASVPLWFEEIYIAMVARLPVPQLVETLRHDIHPPLHYVIEHFWQALGARSGFELKLLPILLAVASILVSARLARRMFGVTAGLLTAALLAVSHGHVRLTQEAQAFALEGLLLVLALSSAWDWIETRRTRSAVTYVLWGACAMYTHYVSLAFLVVLGAWGVVMLRREPNALGRWIGLHAALALAFVPQLPTQISQFIQEDAAHNGHFPQRSDWFALAHELAGATYLIPVYGLLALLPLFDRSRRRAATLLLVLAILPLLSMRLWSLNFPRETCYVALLLLPLVAAGALAVPGRVPRLLVVAALLAFELHGDLRPDLFGEPVMLRRAETEMARRARPGDTILHSDTHSLLFFRFYDPDGDHRIVWRGDESIPYFDGGLMVPATWRITPAAWDSLNTLDARWWAVSLNRAQVRPVHGHARTGAELDSVARMIPGARSIDFAPVRLWESAAVARAAGASGTAAPGH